jgi:hypothetical protein
MAKMGAPKKKLENLEFNGWDMLEKMAPFYICEDIAETLKISSDSLTLRIKERYGLTFPEYKTKSLSKVRGSILAKQYELAIGGNVTLLIWLGKQYCNQTDKVEETTKSEVKQEIAYVCSFGGTDVEAKP